MRLEVQRIYTCAAAVTHIHHSEQPKVWGVVTNLSLVKELSNYQLIQQGNMHIAGLNGLVLGVAKERGLDGICLLGEVPTYATRIQNPKAALAVLNILTRMLGVEIDVAELVMLSKETEERMRQVASEAMEEYIDRFTEPIWEQEPDEGDEED
jgi:proteasome assembly chaperone (PAC2) family protein